ncbi:MAG: hypothetical protein KC777_15505 [Cyanobacteria bacterium HKST-UBA02]|nr:hypothetical protein [Cyanobacteria bacterium HKST-UBA02]
MNSKKLALALSAFMAASLAPGAFADSHNISIRDGKGEELTVKNGLLGSKTTVVKDRLGNKYEKKKGLFKKSSTEASAFGNSVKKKKGLFGSSQTEVTTILGDKVTTKKGVFGRRQTTVEAGGLTDLVGQFLSSGKTSKTADN